MIRIYYHSVNLLDAALKFKYQRCNSPDASCYRAQLDEILIGITPDLSAVDMDLKDELSNLQFVHVLECQRQQLLD